MVAGYLALGMAVVVCFSLALSFTITRRRQQKVSSTPGEFGLELEEIQFSTSDNLQLLGWWIPSVSSQRVIIFLHGFNGSMDPDLKYAPGLVAAGFNVLMFDFRAHGRSEGNLTSMGAVEVRDVEAAIRFALNRGVKEIGLLGFSMGGRAALLTAAGNPAIKALVSDGGPVSFSTALTEGMRNKGIPLGLRHILAWLIIMGISIRSGENLVLSDPNQIKPGKIQVPTLLIHGERDPYTTQDELRKMVSILGPKTDLWVVPGVGHRETDEPDFTAYLNRIIDFFDQWM